MLQSMAHLFALYTLMLFVPGYLLLRCLRMPRTNALCCAPIISTALVAVLGEVYYAAHVDVTPATVFGPTIAIPLVVLVVLALRDRRRAQEGHAPEEGSWGTVIEWWMLLVFAFVGVVICNNLFISELSSLETVMMYFDAQHHLNTIQAFVDARCISSRVVFSYMSAADKAIAPFGSPTFYPAVWYGQCALLMQATGISAPAAINVSLAVTLALAYPLSACAFASSVFGDRRHAVAFSALTCVAFAMFPWCLLIFGPLYPNLVGFVLMPASMALCMAVIRPEATLRERGMSAGIALLALVGQALLHPNTLFSMFVILVPFVAQQIFFAARERLQSLVKAIAATAGFLVVCYAFWMFCFKSPLFYGVIREYWSDFAYPWQEVVNILTQTYTLFFFSEITAQVLLGVLVIIGFVRCAYDRQTRWVALSYLWACFICFVGASVKNAHFKRMVAGFWYTDAMRLAATAITVAILLAACGLTWVFDESTYLLDLYNARLKRKTHPRIVAAVMAACFLVLNFMPSFNWPGAHSELSDLIDQYRLEGHEYDANTFTTTFGDFRERLRAAYSNHSAIDVHEDVFLRQVKQIVGDDLVVNNPYDGSTIAYGMYGIRTYYRRAHGYGGESETSQSVAIRTALDTLADDTDMRQAVDDIGARYVLLLSTESSGNSFLRIRSNVLDGAYDGIARITTDTPGFTEVLASGACHLYRIDD